MSLAYRFSGYNRRRKWQKFLKIIRPTPDTSILDVGFSDNEYSKNDNFIEKTYPYPKKIVALGVETPKEFLKRYPDVKAVTYDGKVFPFEDKQFDVCWSNAVVEHVGDRDRQILFLEQLNRVSRVAFITTPNKYFPVEVHTRVFFLHYLPKRIFDKYLVRIGKKWASGDYMNLLSFREIKKCLRDAGISNFKIIKNRFLFFTLDFIIIFGDV